MSYVIENPEMMTSAATDLATIGSSFIDNFFEDLPNLVAKEVASLPPEQAFVFLLTLPIYITVTLFYDSAL